MIRTIEAIVDDQGRVKLLEALVTILDEPAGTPSEAALLAEQALGVDWNRTEEDEAWENLQPEHCSNNRNSKACLAQADR